jgi:NADH dehydrogenase
MILLTGATGLVGSALLHRLLERGEHVRCLVRDPRRLGPRRVRVQITLGDLSDPWALRQSVRGVEAIVHLAASIRDQPRGTIEELNGLATARLLREAEDAGVERFLFFSALGATPSSRTRFFRSKALAEQAVLAADVPATVIAPSIVYAPGDEWFGLLHAMMRLPWMPVSGSGSARFAPMWVEDAADCTLAALDEGKNGQRRYELAGPDVVTYDEIVKLALEMEGRRRPLLHFPLGVVRASLSTLERIVGPSVFATWEEAELMEESMVSERGTADARALGVDPKPMREVLGLASEALAQPADRG